MDNETIKSHKKELRDLTSSHFEEQLLYASLNNLRDKRNKLRFNNFACSIRAFADFVLKSLSEDKLVKSCVWYKDDKVKKGRVTRNDRIKFAIQKGLPDDYVIKFYDVSENIEEIKEFFELVNKFTHVDEDTFNISEAEVDDNAKVVVQALSNFLTSIKDYPKALITELSSNVDDALIDHIVSDTIDSIDELSTHHSIEGTQVESIKAKKITNTMIKIKLKGTIDVRQQYGSDGDVSRGDGVEIYSSFPFTSKLQIDIAKDFSKSKYTITSFHVDTSEWDK